MSSGTTDQVVLTLSHAMNDAAAHAVETAAFPMFKTGTVIKLVADHTYKVSIDDRLVDIPVYGDCHFQHGEKVYIISPFNSKNYHDMFILGKAVDINSSTSADHKTLMDVVEAVNRKIDKNAVVQETGQGTTNIMSQKAVTDALEELAKNNIGIRSVICGTSVLPVTSDGTVTIPVATTAKTGVVLAASGENEIAVDSTGVMTLNSVDIKRVNQHAEDIVVLDGGKA